MNQQNLGSKRAASPAGKIAEKSQETTGRVKDAVVEGAQQVRQRVSSSQEQATGRIRGIASHLRQMSDTLRDEEPLVANMAERATLGVESLAEYVSHATPQSIVRDTERLARRQPVLFYGAALVAGLALGRFVKGARSAALAYDGSTDGEDEYQPWQDGTRSDRSSGFFPASSGRDRATRSNQRFRENYDSTFAPDASADMPYAGSTERQPRERQPTDRPGTDRQGERIRQPGERARQPGEQRPAVETGAETTTGIGVSLPATPTRVPNEASGKGTPS